MIDKNKSIVEQVKTNTGDSKQVEKDFAAQVDELELIKPEIASAKESYDLLVKKVAEAFENLGDTTTTK